MAYQNRTVPCKCGPTMGQRPIPVQGGSAPIQMPDLPLTMAFVAMQVWGDLYDLERGFERGTIFPCLDKPFAGGCCHEK